MTIKSIDLFSGPGGLTLGMKQAGFEPIAAVEERRDAVVTYEGHTPNADHYNSDIRKIDFTKYAGRCDVIYGGPPCQPFSTGGLRQGKADARNMFPEFIRALEEISPSAFLCENVPGLATRSHLRYLVDLLNRFEVLGYRLSWQVVSAADYGVPQKRKRVIIVGMRDNDFWFPKPTHGPRTNRAHVATRSVVSIDPPLGDPPDCHVTYAKCPDPRKSPYAGHVYNGGGRPINLDEPCHTILASAGGCRTHWIDTLNVAPDYTRHLLSGGAPREGKVPGARRLSVKESALIQTFPTDMEFFGSRSSQFTQVGDAVPPVLGAALGKALFEQLEGKLVSPDTHFTPPTSSPSDGCAPIRRL